MIDIWEVLALGESKTAVAFANTNGGQIVIGVSDNGSVNGQSFGKKAPRDYVNRIATTTEPA